MAKEITEQEYRNLKESVEAAQSEADRAQGALDALMKRLKDEYGCDNVAAAEAKLKKLQASYQTAKEDFEEKQRAYEKKWNPDAR